MSESANPNSQQAAANWIDAWLETQRGWLGRWQSTALEQRVDAARAAMDTLRQHFDPANLPPEALNVAQSFQSLLHSCLVHFANLAEPNAAGDPNMHALQNTWQQLLAAFPLGVAREQQLAWQEYLSAQADYRTRLQAVLQAFAKVFAQSLDSVPAQVDAKLQAGTPVQSFRELYELWIESGERAFAELAHNAAFTAAQAASGNALSRLKLAQQTLIDHWLKSYDLPTRAELNTVHQRLRAMSARIAELEQQLAAAKKPRGKKA